MPQDKTNNQDWRELMAWWPRLLSYALREGRTQAALARVLDVSEGTISKWKTLKHPPSPSAVLRVLAEALRFFRSPTSINRNGKAVISFDYEERLHAMERGYGWDNLEDASTFGRQALTAIVEADVGTPKHWDPRRIRSPRQAMNVVLTAFDGPHAIREIMLRYPRCSGDCVITELFETSQGWARSSLQVAKAQVFPANWADWSDENLAEARETLQSFGWTRSWLYEQLPAMAQLRGLPSDLRRGPGDDRETSATGQRIPANNEGEV